MKNQISPDCTVYGVRVFLDDSSYFDTAIFRAEEAALKHAEMFMAQCAEILGILKTEVVPYKINEL